jgi:hypothetical protein
MGGGALGQEISGWLLRAAEPGQTRANSLPIHAKATVLQPGFAKCPSCGGQACPDAAEEGSKSMRKSLLSLIIIGALVNWTVPGLAAENTQLQPSSYAPKPGPEFLSSGRARTNFFSASKARGAPFGWRR